MSRALRTAAAIGLVVLAAAGLAGAALWVLAQLGVAQPLVVVSDSMRPALRSGDLLLAVRTPVRGLVPGDIVSVARDDESRFVTHRLVEAAPTGDGDWSLTLKGDANPVADPARYRVGGHVLKVVWRSPVPLPLSDVRGTAADAAAEGIGTGVGIAAASWADAIHAVLEVATAVPGPAPYLITTSTAWDRIHGTSGAACHPGAEIEYDWTPAGTWQTLDGGGDSETIEATLGWGQRIELATTARCRQDGRVSAWVPATNNGVAHGLRRPYVSALSGYTDAATRRFEAHFQCPTGTTSSTVRIGLRRNGSSPTTVLWSAAGSHLVRHWTGTMGDGSVWMHVDCRGPWGTIGADATHRFGPGCVPTIRNAICTNYYRG